MTLATLLTQTVTVTTRSTSGTDDYGNPVDTWGTPVQYRARVEPEASSETSGDANVSSEEWRLVLPADAVIGPSSRVEYDGATFEVIGKPFHHPTPRGVSHIEARLALSEAL